MITAQEARNLRKSELDQLVDWVDKQIKKVCSDQNSISINKINEKYLDETVDGLIGILKTSGYSVREYRIGDQCISLGIKW
jgi:hypothetical protein